MVRILILLGLFSWPAALAAQEGGRFDFGGDVFVAGRVATLADRAPDDAFLAGDRVVLGGGAGGSAHAAGRRVEFSGEVGGDLYAAGMDVSVAGPVAGDATLAGYDVSVSGAVGGDLRASGSQVSLAAPVEGYALLAGETVRLDAPVAGDATITARDLAFGEGASVAGELILYQPPGVTSEVPERVAPADRVTRRVLDKGGPRAPEIAVVGWRGAVLGFVGGILVTGLLATLLAAVAPALVAGFRRSALARPFRTLWIGFLTLSTLAGATIVLALTLVGLLVSPATVVLGLLVGLAGYVVGVYVFGVGLLSAFGRGEPDSIGDRALAAFAGALVAALAALIPLLGWIFALLLALFGVGAMAERLLRPRFLGAPGEA